ncbi:hypothetical protein BS78_07G189500 [Paspalum vaginatum]|nr:hypothetical protein BS78_07G189500 [Paspalum vaginatum]
MTMAAPSGSVTARKQGQGQEQAQQRRGVQRPAGGREHRRHKDLGWTGVRERLWGGWAAEIRVPRSRDRLWVGRFEHAVQAALAYDAAVFCFYGERLPRPRKFNFPATPRPDIPEHVRVGLTVANIKAIAEKYARTCSAGFVPLPPPVIPAPPAASLNYLMAPAADGAAATGATTGTEGHGNGNYVDEDFLASADCLLSCNPDDFIGVMDLNLVSDN